VYLASVVPLLFLAWARRSLREPPRFARLLEEGAPARRAPLLALLRGPRKKLVLQLGVVWFFLYIATQNAVSVWKDYAMTELSLPEKTAGLLMTVAALVSMPLVFFSGKLLDALGRRWGATVIFGLTSLGVLGSYLFRSPALLGLSLTLAVFGVSAVLTVMNAFTTELFPTEERGSAFALGNNLLGRVGYVLSPLLVGELARSTGWGPPLRVTALSPLLALLLLWLWFPETSGRAVDDEPGSR
jgi:putative MFS transporter